MNKWKVFKGMMKVGMFLTILFAVFQVGVMYLNYLNEYEEGNFIKFLTYKEEETFQTFQGSPSESFLYKASLYNKIERTIYVAMFLFVMVEIFDYKEDEKGHWSNILKEKIEKFKKKHEEKENDE